MNSDKLKGKKIAVLATDGFEESELKEPMEAIKEAGGVAEIISLDQAEIKAWSEGNWSKTYKVDRAVSSVSAQDYDALLLPGGVINPDKLRKDDGAVKFVKDFFEEGKQKPVGAICHGPWMLAEAGILKGRKITSYDSIKKDLVNAGGLWEDSEVVVDHGLVTSRSPKDLPAFCNKLVEEICEGSHQI